MKKKVKKKMKKINVSLNNYNIPYFIIKNVCRDYGLFPFDVKINESKSSYFSPSGLELNVDSNFNRKQFNLTIVNLYLNNFKNLHGIDVDPVVVNNALASSAGLSDIYFTNDLPLEDAEISGRHFPLFFTLTKNIIFPYMDLNNDYAKLNKINAIGSGKFDYSISDNENVYIGLSGVKEEYRDIALFECINKLHSINSSVDRNLLFEIMSNTDMMRMIYPVVLSFYNEDSLKTDAFLGALQMYSDSVSGRKWMQEKNNMEKVARYEFDGNFWIYGLIEKMLAPARGPDYSIKQKWAPIANAFWHDIESARQKAGISGASLEFMLRVKDPENDRSPEVIQRMIEEIRDE